ncbi:MAG: Abi-alpha family protein [Syntrophorhabdales bacterium]|jgi:hypothetical protein
MDEETIGEIAKTTGKALEITEGVGRFVSKILGDACAEFGNSLHDWAKYFRYKNLLRIQDRVDQIHRKRELEGRTIPLKPSIGIPLIQAASIVEDESLQEMWACLIANSTDPCFEERIKRSFVDILSSLDPIDAHILDWFSHQGWSNALREISIESISKSLNMEKADVGISLSNLNRLGLIDLSVPTTPGHILVSASDTRATYLLSRIGCSLLTLCKE